MYVLVLDVGSASSKVVILDEDKNIVSSSVVQVGTGSSGPSRALDEALGKVNLTLDDMKKIVATGYGRYAFEFLL